MVDRAFTLSTRRRWLVALIVNSHRELITSAVMYSVFTRTPGHITHHDSSLQNYPSGHLRRWATPWSAEEMLDGQHQRVDVSAHARTAYKGLPQKEDFC